MTLLGSLLGYEGRLKIGEIQVDASIEESHVLSAEVTEHPVEEGSDTTDNYRKKVTPVSIVAVVTEAPLATGFPGQTLVNSVGSALSKSDPVQDAWDTFNLYFDKAQVITIATKIQTYQNVVLTNVKVTRNAEQGNALHFTLEAKQLRIVSTEEVAAAEIKAATATAQKAEGKKSKGRKPTKKRSQSTLFKGLQKSKSFFGA